jgi:hypothetical protein
MPILIRELVITASIDKSEAGPSSPAPAAVAADDKSREEIVQTCVDQVMRILKDQNRR